MKIIIKKTRTKYILLTLLIVLLITSLSFNVFYFPKDDNETQISSIIYEQNVEYFNKYINRIIDDFQYDDYEEIVKQYNHLLALPLSKSDENFANRQKMFVYHNDTTNMLITVILTVSEHNDVGNDEWIHSYDVSPELVNRISEQNEIIVTQVPNIEMASQSFNINGCNVTVMVMSDILSEKNEVARVLIDFNNTFIQFLKNIN
ncbi:hypothetical protein HZI73_26350 (plasmid) [Vallitalea pronyensis]|uniref:Uncharacterized protein n=1 Tax=Vallitalea pronyensis TaxID=1348613 RepID=A0A8J8MQD8_9FIRM|nr:hypothetical protein [Vallitalea pronyensis]QUI25937.1 hypothetical protein HZI73_26350 [Vallitalea pronyensis]